MMSSERKLEFLVNVFIQQMGIPQSETDAYFGTKEPAPPYHSPVDHLENNQPVKPCPGDIITSVILSSSAPLPPSTCPPSTSWQPTSSQVHQQAPPLSKTPSPVGDGSLVRLPPPPHNDRRPHRLSRGERGGERGGEKRGERGEERGGEGRRQRRREVAEEEVYHEELDRSFSGSSLSQENQEYCSSPAQTGDGDCYSRARPFIAEDQSDSDSEPPALSPHSAMGEKAWIKNK
ncbi:hypothetical protein NHX12_029949 [Muraenolepis orangiensis]|uniref:Uncharacterized protein n=1 Tax=Muraenolepis orangiensis TaxID=630683 RepID=A0A9Q0E7Q4_9TELE|nr:hypothetical protein NHX12_029949 [Muraenolepis orangiensis]